MRFSGGRRKNITFRQTTPTSESSLPKLGNVIKTRTFSHLHFFLLPYQIVEAAGLLRKIFNKRLIY